MKFLLKWLEPAIFVCFWRWVFLSVIDIRPLALCKVTIRRVMFIFDCCFRNFDGALLLAYTGARVIKSCVRCRSMKSIFGTTFSSIVSVCCWMLMIPNFPSAILVVLLYASLSVALEFLSIPVSGGLSPKTLSFVLKSGCSRRRLLLSNLYPFCVAVTRLLTFSLMRSSLSSERLRHMRGETSPYKYDGIASEMSNVAAPGVWRD